MVVRLEGTNVDQGKRILKVNLKSRACWILTCQFDDLIIWNFFFFFLCLQESGMTLITAEDLDDAAEKAVKASSN